MNGFAALRERPEDVLTLARHFLAKWGRAQDRSRLTLAPEVEPWLSQHAWPGNVRELENVIERGVVLTRGGQIGLDDLLAEPDAETPAAAAGSLQGFLDGAPASTAERVIGCGPLNQEAGMATFPREEIEKAWRRRIELQDADDWEGYGKTFTSDAVYLEHHEGTFVGRAAILAWLVPVMEKCKGWTFPVEWLAIDGNRVIHKWLNRLPGKRPDGTHYEFAGLSISEYAGNGQFSFQEDIYNWEESLKVLKEYAAAQNRAR